jgi:signal transduction histidine kinase
MAPIAAFTRSNPDLPIYGDDPRDPGAQRVFSAAPIEVDGRREGFLYIVLGGEAYRSVAQMFEGSYVLRLSTWLSIGGIALAVLVGAFAFRVLCRRLGALSKAMAQFERSDFQVVQTSELPARAGRGDEIDQLARMFKGMSGRIAEQIAKLQKVDASRRELVMHISHDLRTPLASLQGYLDTLVMKGDSLPGDTRRDYLDAALGINRRLRGMIGDLFELATLEVYTSPLRPETFAMEELAQDVCQKYAPKAQERSIALRPVFSTVRSYLFADIGLIERALANLLDNALKFTPRGGEVLVTVDGEDSHVTVRVRDTGVGIAPEQLGSIFDRFYRVEAAAGGEGSGLGLAIVKRIAELHGGTVKAESAPGTGSTFALRLPKVP